MRRPCSLPARKASGSHRLGGGRARCPWLTRPEALTIGAYSPGPTRPVISTSSPTAIASADSVPPAPRSTTIPPPSSSTTSSRRARSMWITVPRTVTSGRVSSAVGVSVVTVAIGSLSPAKAVARNTATAWMKTRAIIPPLWPSALPHGGTPRPRGIEITSAVRVNWPIRQSSHQKSAFRDDFPPSLGALKSE